MPKAKTSATRTDAQRRAGNKWDYANRTVIGCKVDRDTAAAYKAHCAAAGTTVNAAIRAFVLSQIQRDNAAGED